MQNLQQWATQSSELRAQGSGPRDAAQHQQQKKKQKQKHPQTAAATAVMTGRGLSSFPCIPCPAPPCPCPARLDIARQQCPCRVNQVPPAALKALTPAQKQCKGTSRQTFWYLGTCGPGGRNVGCVGPIRGRSVGGTYLARLSEAGPPIRCGSFSAVPLAALDFPTCPDTYLFVLLSCRRYVPRTSISTSTSTRTCSHSLVFCLLSVLSVLCVCVCVCLSVNQSMSVQLHPNATQLEPRY